MVRDALSAAGFAAAAQQDDGRAAQWFLRLEQAVPDSPLLPEAHLHAGIHLQRAGRDEESAAVLDRLLAAADGTPSPWSGEACWWRGQAERRRAGAKAALPFFERGLAAKPAKELADRLQLARADALFDAGDFDAARSSAAAGPRGASGTRRCSRPCCRRSSATAAGRRSTSTRATTRWTIRAIAPTPPRCAC